MAIHDSVPKKKEEVSLPVHHDLEADSLQTFQNSLNELFDDFFRRPFGLSTFSENFPVQSSFLPELDISDTEKELRISADIPGMKAEDIDISLDGNTLTISGKKTIGKMEKGKRFYRQERSHGSFRRSIPLPEEVEEDQISASYKLGVLNIIIPKTERKTKERKHIKIKKG